MWRQDKSGCAVRTDWQASARKEWCGSRVGSGISAEKFGAPKWVNHASIGQLVQPETNVFRPHPLEFRQRFTCQKKISAAPHTFLFTRAVPLLESRAHETSA